MRLQAEKEIAKTRAQFGDKIPVEPSEALLSVLHLSAGQLAWLHAELEERADKTGDFESQVLMLWNDERDRVARVSEAALRAGVQERAIRLAENYGQQLAEVLRAIFYDARARHERRATRASAHGPRAAPVHSRATTHWIPSRRGERGQRRRQRQQAQAQGQRKRTQAQGEGKVRTRLRLAIGVPGADGVRHGRCAQGGLRWNVHPRRT